MTFRLKSKISLSDICLNFYYKEGNKFSFSQAPFYYAVVEFSHKLTNVCRPA
jgi:hypothetical protein